MKGKEAISIRREAIILNTCGGAASSRTNLGLNQTLVDVLSRLPLLAIVLAPAASAQPYLSNLSATAGDPIFATYAAPLARSSYIVDEGYRFVFYEEEEPIRFSTDHSGDLGMIFRRDGDVVRHVSELHDRPVITTSYGDVVKYTYRPFPLLRVDAVFQVYSSGFAVHQVEVLNEGPVTTEISIFPYLHHAEGMKEIASAAGSFTFRHLERLDGWMESKRDQIPYVPERRDVLLLSEQDAEIGAYSTHDDFLEDVERGRLTGRIGDSDTAVVAFRLDLSLEAGETKSFRMVRGVDGAWADPQDMIARAEQLATIDMDEAVRENELLYARIPKRSFDDPDVEMMYWTAFNLIRQLMMPAEGKSSYNHYVYSREPTWGWGYAGQVFHESITMLAYAYLDPESARNSQRVFMERQWADGYIPYRVGPYLDESIFTRGEFTASAPWFSWENWEIYRISRDSLFLQDAYDSGAKLYDWWIKNRDDDDDGLMEWGGHAVLESIRDSEVAVWDEVGWPNEFESPDLNAMLVSEARSLAKMAQELGLSTEAAEWTAKADERAEAVRTLFWDDEDGFFYYLDKRDNDFTFASEGDLKRQEIVGFFPLWAGIASREQAARLVEHLQNTEKFGRAYGIPSLAADDPYYNPKGYWNGPVWIELNYLVFRGLLDYGYHDLARELAGRIFANVIHHLKTDHTFWEFYSPDEPWAGYHQTYVWTGIVARMVIDLDGR